MPCHAHRTLGRLAPRPSLRRAGGWTNNSFGTRVSWSLGSLVVHSGLSLPAGESQKNHTHAPVGDLEERNARWIPHGTCQPASLLCLSSPGLVDFPRIAVSNGKRGTSGGAGRARPIKRCRGDHHVPKHQSLVQKDGVSSTSNEHSGLAASRRLVARRVERTWTHGLRWRSAIRRQRMDGPRHQLKRRLRARTFDSTGETNKRAAR